MTQDILQPPPPFNNQLQAELQSMRSSIQALTKSVADLQPRVKRGKSQPTQPTPFICNPSAQGKGPTPSCAQIYVSKAASTPQPSLVLDLGATNPDDQFDSTINDALNGYMHEIGCDKVKFSATRYNKKGNLVLTAHHTTMQAQINSVTEDIKNFIECFADTNSILAGVLQPLSWWHGGHRQAGGVMWPISENASYLVNTLGHCRNKNATYLGPAWPKHQHHPVAPRMSWWIKSFLTNWVWITWLGCKHLCRHCGGRHKHHIT